MHLCPAIIPCDSALCREKACRILQWDGEVIAYLCPEHEWRTMRNLAQKVKKYNPREAEQGWQKFCRERGYSSLATTWLAAVSSWKDPSHV